MADGKFGTAINCMDGRVQEPVANLLKVRYGVEYVDTITEPGPIKLMAENEPVALESIRKRLMISIEKHHSSVVAVVGHHDCAGNPVPKDQQIVQIRKSLDLLKQWHPGVKLVGIYVSDAWLADIVE
jgi:hypothetical protein